MKANKTMLIAALAAGSLLAWSPALRADDTNKPPSAPPAGAPPAGQPSRTGFERMAEQLNLTADQKTKVQSIMDKERQKMLDLRNDTSLSQEDRQAKRKAVVEDTALQMKAVLTPEQFDKWQKTSPMGTRRPHSDAPPAGTIAYGQAPSRKPLPEDRLPIPDYYGLYAVTGNGLVGMKVGTPINVGTDVEFIYYAKNASAAESLELYKLPSQIARQNKPKDDGKFKGWNNFMQQANDNYEENNAALEGLPRGSAQVEMREKSITGKPEMVRLIPGNMLPPGDYQVGIRGLPPTWFRFSVSGGDADSAAPPKQ
jgi:Spy/CpxP family protein refolding chaperone